MLRDVFDWSRVTPTDPRDELFAHRFAEDGEDAPVALLGVPFDDAVLGRPGAREGPRALREHLAPLKPVRFPGGAVDGLSVRDAGDVDLEGVKSVPASHDLATSAVHQLRSEGVVPVALGGDHSLTYPLARPHAEAGDLAVVNLDAHLDVREVPSGGEPNSGTSFGRLLREGLVEGGNLVEVGVRDLATSAHYAGFARDAGVRVVPAPEVRRGAPRAVAERVLEGLDADGLYLSVDLDVLDQAHGPGVSAPTPGGVTSGTLLDLVDALLELAPVPVVGVDVVELAPRFDEGERTARTGGYVLGHVLTRLAGGGNRG